MGEIRMRRLLTALVCLVLAALFCTAGCSTWKGMGDDVEHVGGEMKGD